MSTYSGAGDRFRAGPGPTQARWNCLSSLCTLEEGDDWKDKSMGIGINMRMSNLHWDGRAGWYNSIVTKDLAFLLALEKTGSPTSGGRI